MTKSIRLCELEQIPDPGSLGLQVVIGGREQEIMLIRRNHEVFGYINACPHTGVCLDWQPGEFLTGDRQRIICSMHGAEFEIDDGFCVSGPCAGDQLQPLPIFLIDNTIVLKPDAESSRANNPG